MGKFIDEENYSENVNEYLNIKPAKIKKHNSSNPGSLRGLKNAVMLIFFFAFIFVDIYTVMLAKDMADVQIETKEVEKTEEENKNTNVINNNIDEEDEEAEVEQIVHVKIPTYFYFAFAIEGIIIATIILYLLMSKFNDLYLDEVFSTPSVILVFIISTLVAAAGIALVDVAFALDYEVVINTPEKKKIELIGKKIVEVDEQIVGLNESSTVNESVVWVRNGANAIFESATLNKLAGDSEDTEKSRKIGVNSVLLVENANATLNSSTINAKTNGSTGIFVKGENSKIILKDSVIYTSGSTTASGITSSENAIVEGNNIQIHTGGESSPAISTGASSGTISLVSSKLETAGINSPLVSGSSKITFESTSGNSASQIAVLDNRGSLSLDKSTLFGSGTGIRNGIDTCGIMLYQSSYDKTNITSSFYAKDSTIGILESSDYYLSAPMFFVTNTTATINLTNTLIKYGSGNLLDIKGTKEWGSEPNNGGNVNLITRDQTLNGNINLDENSSISVNLSNTKFNGSINSNNKGKNVILILDDKSKFTLTADTYVHTLTNSDKYYSNIILNGHKIYVNGIAVK